MESASRLHLRVVPRAESAGIVGRHADAWKVRVRAAPERDAANEAVLTLLAQTLSLPRANISLVSGHASRDKIVRVAGITQADSESRLASAERKDVRR